MAAVWDSEDFSSETSDKRIDDGDYKWVFLHEQWVPAKVERSGGCMLATLENGERVECSADQVYDKVLSLAGLKRLPDNLIHTDDMSEQTIIYFINQKYNSDLIYTSIGDILVAVNPYRLLPLYTPLVMHKYMMDDMGMNLRPHPYAMARRSYDRMLDHNQAQSILISGESGAGKTETTKLCLSFLSEIAASDAEGSQGMEQKILASNPILESFGNAKTLRNNNSSRYGKFINLIFSETGILQGCETKNFLLEKSRVHMQAFGERSYHIFYQLCRASVEEADCFSMGGFGHIAKKQDDYHDRHSTSAAQDSPSMRANLSSMGLKHPDEFNYLNQSGCTDIYLVSDQESFHEMEFAATKLGFSKKQLNIAFSACACVLHLGNLSFVNNETEGCCVEDSELCQVSLQLVAYLLDVSEEVVIAALTKREFFARGEVTLVLLNAAQAGETRDALAKAIYTHCFDFLIHVINVELSVEAFQGRRNHVSDSPTTIGVLDIYGFEVFDMNGFEQLFINYANEKLQQHFNHHTFEEEIKACERENINCEDFTYMDNQDTLNLIESKNSGKSGGILKILDDECKFPRGTDEAFLNKLKMSHKDNPLISFSRKFTDLGFDICHYAGSVNYTVKDFLEKNKDTLSDDLQTLMRNSSVKHLMSESDIAHDEGDNIGKAKAKQLTVAGKFQKDLHNLLVQLNNSEPHFIRCIKPNEEKEPVIFNHAMVHRQLKQSGAFDALSIRKRGYQFQFPHAVFLQRYRPLAAKQKTLDSSKPSRNRCIDLITTLSTKIKGMQSLSKNMQVGDSMVFWKSAEDVMLSELRKEIVRAAVLVLQRFCRGGVIRCRMMKIQRVITAARQLIVHHKANKDSGQLVTFESECELLQQLTIHKDFFDSSNIKPYFEKVLDENLQELEARIDCINQLQLHCHKSLKNIDEGWLAATEKAISLNLQTVESVKMIDMYNREVKNHGKLLVGVLKQLQSADVRMTDIQESIETIDQIRQNEPEFAKELSATLKKNVVQLEVENKLVADLLQTSSSDIAEKSETDHFLPFQQHMNDESLSRNFMNVLKVVDYVVELRDIVLTTLVGATGEDPTIAPFFPAPPPPRSGGVRSAELSSLDDDREVDFENDAFENPSIVEMSGHVSVKNIEMELWATSLKHFLLFEEVKEDLAGKEEFAVVIELAAQEVNAYKEAISMCHSVGQECGSVLSVRNPDKAAVARQHIDDFNQHVAEKCKLLTVSSSQTEDDAENSSHPYYAKRLNMRNKKLFAAQYSLLLDLEQFSRREIAARKKLSAAAAACVQSFGAGNCEANKRCIAALQQAVDELKACRTEKNDFATPDSESLCKAGEYTVQVRQLVNNVVVDPSHAKDTPSLEDLDELLTSAHLCKDLGSFISPGELDSFREQVFDLKVKNDKLRDGKKQFTNDLERAVAAEDEGKLMFLLSKVSSQAFEIDDTIKSLVDRGTIICDKCRELKRLIAEGSSHDATAGDIHRVVDRIRSLGLKGGETHVVAFEARLEVLRKCGHRIHSAWYNSPNSVENMVGALQECTQHNFPSCDDVRFVSHLVGLWREDYGSYLKALIDLRTFLEDTDAVDELNEELNMLYKKGKDEGDVLEEEEEAVNRATSQMDAGDRITEDFRGTSPAVVSSVKCSASTLPMAMNRMSLLGGDASRETRNTNDHDSVRSSLSNSDNDETETVTETPKKTKKVFRKVVPGQPSARARANSDVYVERNTDAYKWYKYPKLRTFTDPERERQRKVYTITNLPTSVTRLDNIIHIQLATAAFKCLLGIMGDKVGSYPEMLKKEFLRIATYHVTLTDELYCQVMKQLTKNPSRASKGKGVELLQLLVSTVLPTQSLQPYLENFLRSHGALEFVNLLRVLAMKKTSKTDKAAEHDTEGWLFNTVGRIMKSYRKRWCVLHGDTFGLFMSKDHNSKIESIPVSQIKSLHYLKKKDENVKAMYAFEILMKNDKSHVFYTTTDQDRTHWVEKTKAAVYFFWSQGGKK